MVPPFAGHSSALMASYPWARKAGTDTLFPKNAGEKGCQSPFFASFGFVHKLLQL
jgi:hypothetical protein